MWRATVRDAKAGRTLGLAAVTFGALRKKHGIERTDPKDPRPRKLSPKQLEEAQELARTLTIAEVAKRYGVSSGTLYRHGITSRRRAQSRPNEVVRAAFRARKRGGQLVAMVVTSEAARALGVSTRTAAALRRRASIAARPRVTRTRAELLRACGARRESDGTWRATVTDAEASRALGVKAAIVTSDRERHGVKARRRSTPLSRRQIATAKELARSLPMAEVAAAFGVSEHRLREHGVVAGPRKRRSSEVVGAAFKVREVNGAPVATVTAAIAARTLGVSTSRAHTLRRDAGIAPAPQTSNTREVIRRACAAQREADGTWRATVSDADAGASVGLTEGGFTDACRRHKIEARRGPFRHQVPLLSWAQLDEARELARWLPLSEVAAAFEVSVRYLYERGVGQRRRGN